MTVGWDREEGIERFKPIPCVASWGLLLHMLRQGGLLRELAVGGKDSFAWRFH